MDAFKNNTDISVISINESHIGDEIFFSVTNNTETSVKLRDIYIYCENHSYTSDSQVVAEGYTMLSQYSGTISNITNFSGFSDKNHYKLRQTDGFTTVYNYAIVENNGKWDLYSFTSCNRFNGRILINENEIMLVIDMENLEVKSGETIELESVYISKGKSYSENIAEMGRLLGKNHKIKLTEKLPTGWCSWYCFGPSLTVKDVENNLSVMKNSLSQLTYIQIDDGYQKYMGDWLDCAEHFGDVKEIISLIRNNGFEPAIWVAPFIAEKDSKLFREHPDYFIKDKNGNPLSSGDFSFGGWRHGPWYMLDGTNPDAQKYLTYVFKTMRDEWKVKYFKLDANVWGALPSDEIVRFDKNSTTVDAYRKGMEAVWTGAGEDSVILGCNAPMWSSVGAVNAMRTSGDLSRDFGTLKMLKKEIFNRNWMHNVLWTNDPDVLTLQNQYTEQIMLDGSVKTSMKSSLNEDELEYQRTMIFASSGMILSGDDMTHYGENEFSLMDKFSVISDYNTPEVRAAVFDEDEAKRTGDRFAVGYFERNGIKYVCMFNDTDDNAVRYAKIVGSKELYSLTNHWTAEDMGTSDGMIEITIQAHGAKLIEVK